MTFRLRPTGRGGHSHDGWIERFDKSAWGFWWCLPILYVAGFFLYGKITPKSSRHLILWNWLSSWWFQPISKKRHSSKWIISPQKNPRIFFHIFSKPLSYVNVENPFAGYYSVIFPLVVEFSRSHLWKLSCHTGSWDISSWHKHCKNYFRWGSQETVRQIFSQQTLFWMCTLIEYTLKTSLLLLPTSEISMHNNSTIHSKEDVEVEESHVSRFVTFRRRFYRNPNRPNPNPNPSGVEKSMLRKPSWALLHFGVKPQKLVKHSGTWDMQ